MKPTDNLVADTIYRTAEIDLVIAGAADVGTITIIDAASVAVNNTCPECGHPGKLRDRILRRLVDLLVVGSPSCLDVRALCFLHTAMSCPEEISRTSLVYTDDGSKLTHHVTHRTFQYLAVDRMSVSITAEALDIGRDLVNQVALGACRQLICDNPYHLDEVRILGVGEHVRKHTRKSGQPSSLVTILVDLTPLIGRRGSA